MANKLIILVIVIVILGGMGGCLAFRVWDPLWNPFRPEPEEVIGEMIAEMEKSKTFQADIELRIKTENKKEFNFNGEFRIKRDISDSQNPKFSLNFGTTLDIQEFPFLLGGEFKIIGEDSYSKLTTLPDLPLLDFYFQRIGLDFSGVKNQWIKIDPVFFKKKKEIIERARELITDEKFYLIKEELEDKIIGENRAYHYTIILDKERIEKLMLELSLFQHLQGKKLDDQKIVECFGSALIGKNDKYLYKFEGETEIWVWDNEKVKIGIDINFSDFNQLIEIASPEEFTPLDIILQGKP